MTKILRNLGENNEVDYKVLHRFLDVGFYDSFVLFHKAFQRSYPSGVDCRAVPNSEQSRIDHLLVSEKLKARCKSLEIVKDAVTDTLSDHYPLKSVFVLAK